MLTEQRKHMFLPIANRGIDLMKTLIGKVPPLQKMLSPNGLQTPLRNRT
jgi:hypothetical protein